MIAFDKEAIDGLTGTELNAIGQDLINLAYGEGVKVEYTHAAITPSGVGVFFMDIEGGSMKALNAYSVAQINYLIEKGIIKQV